MKRKRVMRLAESVKGPMTDHEPINREKLDQFVMGYIRAALETPNDDFFGDGKLFLDNYKLKDISERTICQMVRDCVGFYWRHRVVLEELYRLNLLLEYRAGYMFWNSRNGNERGFDDTDSMDPTWDILHNGAKGYAKFKLTITDGEIDADYITGWYNSGTSI